MYSISPLEWLAIKISSTAVIFQSHGSLPVRVTKIFASIRFFPYFEVNVKFESTDELKFSYLHCKTFANNIFSFYIEFLSVFVFRARVWCGCNMYDFTPRLPGLESRTQRPLQPQAPFSAITSSSPCPALSSCLIRAFSKIGTRRNYSEDWPNSFQTWLTLFSTTEMIWTTFEAQKGVTFRYLPWIMVREICFLRFYERTDGFCVGTHEGHEAFPILFLLPNTGFVCLFIVCRCSV